MYGVVASMIRRLVGSGTPEWVPSGAFIFLDFINELYFAGTERPVDDILIGGFDSGEIYPQGMLSYWDNANRPDFAAFARTLIHDNLENGISVIIEMDLPVGGSFGSFLSLFDVSSWTAAVWLYGGDDEIESYDSEEHGNAGNLPGGGNHEGTVRYAFNIGREDGGLYYYDMAFNGIHVASDGFAYSPHSLFATMTIVKLLNDEGEAGWDDLAYCRSIEIGAVKTVADLLVSSASGIPLSIEATPVTIGTTALGGVYTGFTPFAMGGKPPYTFSIQSGTLPTGLSIDPDTGEISGSPSVAGTQSGIVIRVTDDDGATEDLAAFSITIYPQWAVKTATAHVGTLTNGSPKAMGTLSLGVADSSRVIVALVTADNGNAIRASAVSIGGNAATVKVEQTGQLQHSSIWTVAIAAGTSAAVTITPSGTIFNASMSVTLVAMYETSETAVDTDLHLRTSAGTSYTDDINTVADGVSVGVLHLDTSNTAVSWSGMIEVTDAVNSNGTGHRHSAAIDFDSGTGPRSVTVTTPNSTGVLALASFQP